MIPKSGAQRPPEPGVRGGEAKLILGKYELGKVLGRGASAKVYFARNLCTGQNVAIKCFNKLGVSKNGLVGHIKREVSVLSRLRHPSIIRLHEVLATRSKIYFVLDLVMGGELFSSVSRAGHLTEDISRRYFRQLITAVGYCHSRGVFHRDLKLENLLLDENGDLKISDFGLSAVSDQIGPDGLFHTLCGTPAYVAPEILAKKGYRAATVDLWSCGVILFILVAGYLPFNDHNLIAMYRKIYRGAFHFPKWTSPDLNNLIARLLDTNPDTRITVAEILIHPWFLKELNEQRLQAIKTFHDEPAPDEECYNISKAEALKAENRPLNAFDIIGFSSGADLSGLFCAQEERYRFVLDESPETVLRNAEAAGRSEGLLVSRKGKTRGTGVALRELNGNLVVVLEIYRLSEELTLVEVQRGRATVERKRWAGQFWRDKLQVCGGSVEPAACERRIFDSTQIVQKS